MHPTSRLATTRTLKTRITIADQALRIQCDAPQINAPHHALFIALGTVSGQGAAVVPFGQHLEGSTTFLPFRANRVYRIPLAVDGAGATCRTFGPTLWSEPEGIGTLRTQATSRDAIDITIDLRKAEGTLLCAVYVKDLTANHGWGRLVAALDQTIHGGHGDSAIHRFVEIDMARHKVGPVRHRLGSSRIRIYQMVPRLFGNVNERRKRNGTLAENGVGKFADINAAALSSLCELGFTHLWLTGILRQISATTYPELGEEADDPDLLKGLAGSPYAIKDYFDLCPDYALDPRQRFAEFTSLIERIHAHGLRLLIDFVPNHVARNYASQVRPDQSLGGSDERSRFFHPRNNFFYVHGPGGLRLPSWKDGRPISATCQILGTCDGRFAGERDWARVTGNNVASAEPKLHDWYETVKLNYGFDFMDNVHAYPCGAEGELPVPDTWLKMDEVLTYWQTLGIDGFRCDMAHMVPAEFWCWAIGRARARDPEALFLAEAYDNDPMKVPSADPLLRALNDHRGNVMFNLLNAGFTGVYDDPSYKKLKMLYDGVAWANDLDDAPPHDFIFQNSLRYAENHDEVRLASRDHWGNVGMQVGRPVTAVLFGLSRGPVLLYNGQEVGEPALGSEGFAGDDGRTTIFDYWSMPELVQWVNAHRYDGGRVSEEQMQLRAFYGRLLHLANEPAFRDGDFFALNRANIDNPHFGRMSGETASGHWVYAFLRYDPVAAQRFLVLANLHRGEWLRDVRVRIPPGALQFLALESLDQVRACDRLSGDAELHRGRAVGPDALGFGDLPPLTAFYFELQIEPPHR